MFVVKSVETANFKYLGLSIHQSDRSVTIKQDDYIKSISMLMQKNNYDPDSQLTPEELKECRGTIGKLNWVATQTRPDISFEVSELTSSLKEKGVDSISMINKTIRKVKKYPAQLFIPNLGSLCGLRLEVCCDASFAGHSNGVSQGGYIIYLVGNNNQYVPISWQSRRIRRVVKSTHAAETLAMVDAMEAAVFFRQLMLEVTQSKDIPSNIPIVCSTDNKSLYDSAYTSTQILDKRLRIETAIIREMLDQGVIHQLKWIPTSQQIADGLTKRGVPAPKILGHFGVARVSLP